MMDDKINWQIFDEACDKAYDIVGLILIEAGSEAAKYLSNSIMNRLSQSVNKAMPSIEGGNGVQLTGSFNTAAGHWGEMIQVSNDEAAVGAGFEDGKTYGEFHGKALED
jgi:hypothetical protein